MSSTGIDLIAQERRRQKVTEGFSLEGDCGQSAALARAAACYSQVAVDVLLVGKDAIHWIPELWPFHYDEWKPSEDPKKNLIKAGALLAASLDALDMEDDDELP